MFLSSVISLSPSLFWVFFLYWFWFGSTFYLCSHLPEFSLIYFLSPCYNFCFLSLSFYPFLQLLCSALLWVPLSSSLGSFSYLFVDLLLFFSSLYCFSDNWNLRFFTLYLSISFAVYASYLSSLILFWIVVFSTYFVSSLVGFLAVQQRQKSPQQMCTPPTHTVFVHSLLPLQYFLVYPNWRHLSHKAGLSLFIFSRMHSPTLIICRSRVSFSNSSSIIGGFISLLSSFLLGTHHIFQIPPIF